MTRAIVVVSSALLSALILTACGGGDNGGCVVKGPTQTAQTAVGTAGEGEGPPPLSVEPTVTESCLQIFDIEVGTGAEAALESTITVHYTGWLEDGTVFDSTIERDQPLTYVVDDFIEGWREGIPGMKVGGKRRLIVPSDLAYGEAGGGAIPPDADLTFDVELLAVEPP